MASGNNFKAPSSLTKCSSYEAWLKELKIWQSFTDIPKAKQGQAVFLTLEGKARETVLEFDVGDINSDNGVKNITACLDSLYLKDKTQTAYEAYDSFERFRRPDDMAISDYINESEKLLNKIKWYGSDMSTDILTYRLLKSANLSEQHQQLARAAITELKYGTMKTQLKKIFGDNSDFYPSCLVEVEMVNECTHEEQRSILIKDQVFMDQILITTFVQGEGNNLMVTFLVAIEFLVLGVIRMQEEGPLGCMQINLTLEK